MVNKTSAELCTGGDLTEVTTLQGPAESSEPVAHMPWAGSVGLYTIEKAIGGGGAGVVYAAKHRESGRRVAIKVLRSDMAPFPSMIARFLREAEAASKIHHPNIVEIFEVGQLDQSRPYYVMELLEGEDLRSVLAGHGRFSPQEALQILDPVCGAIQAAHDAGIIHRDIKASNVMIVDSAEGRKVKLLDFGIAKMLHGDSEGQGLTEPGTMVGTAYAMAPEQIRGERLDGRADIYALGVLIYQLLTGQYPFHAADFREVALLHLQVPAPRPSSVGPVSPALDAVVLRCLEKQPGRRFSSAVELLAAFRAAVAETPPSSLQPDQLAPALGVYFELTLLGDDDMDDAVVEDIGNVLDVVDAELASRGLKVPLKTSQAVLGILLIAGDEQRELEQMHVAIGEVLAAVAERPDPHPRLRPQVSLTLGQVLCRASANGPKIVGGPLLKVGNWAAENRLSSTATHSHGARSPA